MIGWYWVLVMRFVSKGIFFVDVDESIRLFLLLGILNRVSEWRV